MDLSPHIVRPHVKRATPPQQSGRKFEDELLKLTDRIAADEDVPIEYAYRLALIRLNEEEAK